MASIVENDNNSNGEIAKCISCNDFYGYYKFENFCSDCLYKSNSNKYHQLISEKYLGRHTQSYLYNFVFKYKIPSNSKYFKSLKEMFRSGEILDNQKLFSWIDYVKKNTQYLGISVNQAIELKNTYLISPYVHLSKNTINIIVHIVSGLVLDIWNLDKNSNKLGSAVCYYSCDKIDLRYDKPLKASAAFSDYSYWKYHTWLRGIKN